MSIDFLIGGDLLPLIAGVRAGRPVMFAPALRVAAALVRWTPDGAMVCAGCRKGAQAWLRIFT